jgi:hypothetical protein
MIICLGKSELVVFTVYKESNPNHSFRKFVIGTDDDSPDETVANVSSRRICHSYLRPILSRRNSLLGFDIQFDGPSAMVGRNI